MRINNVFAGRPAYYDRNPINVATTTTTQAAAPHAMTDRFTYTVPAGRKAIVNSVQVMIERLTAATTPNLYSSNARRNFTTWLVVEEFISNNVGDRREIAASPQTVLVAADPLEMSDVDASTGGTVNFIQGVFITEFDA